MCSKDVRLKWQDIGSIPIQASRDGSILSQAPSGYCTVALTEDELTQDSLPAAIQWLLWPHLEVVSKL